MTLRYFRRIRLFPGARINLSRSGLSLSLGTRGAWFTIGPKGRRATVGIPGSGFYWTERIPPAAPPHTGHRLAFAALVIVAGLIVWWIAVS